jgi:hypothetical protein
MRVQAGADGRAAERDLPNAPERGLDPLGALAHLRRVAAELLAERHRHRVHQMRAPGLDDVVELRRLRLQRRSQLVERRQQIVGELVERREMHGGGEHVVRRLPHVHVVVRVHVVARERGHHLVRVHVRRGPRAGLEDVDRELVVQLAARDAVAGVGDALRLVLVQQPELRVHARGGRLDAPEPARDRRRNRLARDGEVLDCLTRLVPPQLAPLLRLRHHGESSEGPVWPAPRSV